MHSQQLKDYLFSHILPRVRMPAQYIGGELNIVRKDPAASRGRLCLCFPDTYSIGMSHHGLQVLYSLMNARDDWACERAFTPLMDMEAELRRANLPLYSLENFQPLSTFDVVGFTLQYEICTSNLLTMLDLGGIPLRAADRTLADPLIIAGGPCAQNPEPLAPFVDLFVSGDGEPSLPRICDLWKAGRDAARSRSGWSRGPAGQAERADLLAELAAELPYAYVPRFYEPEYFADGRLAALHRTRSDVPETIEPSVIDDLDGIPLPLAPIVPFVECVHDRISIEIMRGCPWQCRFCQSTVIKRPLRIREVETIVAAALETYRNTGYEEISLLSLSTSDYPHFEKLVQRMHETFRPLGVNISVPSLRVNEQLKSVAALVDPRCRSSLTLAPEVARDDMREQIRKRIKNEDLYEGCRAAFHNGFQQVKLYFLCGLPGERDGRSRWHYRDVGKDLANRPRGDRPLCQGDGQRLELCAQVAHALSMERHANAGLFRLGPSLSAQPLPLSQRAGQMPRHRDQHSRRRAQSWRPPGERSRRTGMAARIEAGKLA